MALVLEPTLHVLGSGLILAAVADEYRGHRTKPAPRPRLHPGLRREQQVIPACPGRTRRARRVHYSPCIASVRPDRARALANHGENVPRCFVTCRDERGGEFYAYAAASIERTTAPGAGAAKHARSGAVNLLSRLAVDRNERGKGTGGGCQGPGQEGGAPRPRSAPTPPPVAAAALITITSNPQEPVRGTL